MSSIVVISFGNSNQFLIKLMNNDDIFIKFNKVKKVYTDNIISIVDIFSGDTKLGDVVVKYIINYGKLNIFKDTEKNIKIPFPDIFIEYALQNYNKHSDTDSDTNSDSETHDNLQKNITKCSWCGKCGHIRQFCWRMKKYNGKQKNPKVTLQFNCHNNKVVTHKTCDWCDKQDHIYKDCPDLSDCKEFIPSLKCM